MLAEAFWRTRFDSDPAVCEVAGIAGNTRSEPDATEASAQIYVPFTQLTPGDIFLVVRPESGDAAALVPSVRAAIGRVDREQLVSVRNIMTLEDIGRQATARYRFRATLVLAFAGLALLLAMVGLFGVLAYSVQRRWHEYGVRMTLGAKPRDVISLITSGAVRLLVPGVLVGSGLAIGAGQLLAALLFGVRPLDAMTFAAVLGVLTVTAAASVTVPAWRADTGAS